MKFGDGIIQHKRYAVAILGLFLEGLSSTTRRFLIFSYVIMKRRRNVNRSASRRGGDTRKQRRMALFCLAIGVSLAISMLSLKFFPQMVTPLMDRYF